MNIIFDVIISGGGPSGTLLGYFLSQNGIKTLIIEKEIFPRLKVCAGGIQHRVLELLPFGIRPVIENTISGIYFSYSNRDIFFKEYESPILYTVDRRKFDNFLAEKAIKAGCEIKFGEKTTGYNVGEECIDVMTTRASYSSRILVGADGIRGLVHGQFLGGKKINKILAYMVELPYKDGTGRKKFVLSDRNNNLFDLYSAVRLDFNMVQKGYSWIFPKKDFFSFGIGVPLNSECAGSIEQCFFRFLNDFYYFDSSDNYTEPILAHGIPIMDSYFPLKSHRIIMVGDAACLADSFTGEGLYNSIRSVIIAADSIKSALRTSSYNFEDYDRKIKDNILRDIRFSKIINRIFYSHSSFFYKLIKKNDNYFYACCRFLRGERTYSDAIKKITSLNIVK